MTFGDTSAPDPRNPNNGYILPQPPDDSISRIRFSPETTPSAHLLASSWNGSVRLWSIESSLGPANGILETTLTKPALDCIWSSQGESAFISCADNFVYRWDLKSNQRIIVAAHDKPVRQCVDNSQLGVLASVSWDQTLRYWDIRSPPNGNSVANVNLGERAYAIDSLGVVMIVVLAQRKIQVFDIRKPTSCFQQRYSHLNAQSRCVACWPDAMGYCIGSVDGHVSVESIQNNDVKDRNVFPCHQDRNGPFIINSIRFNHNTGAVATGASDGHVFVWDKNRMSRAGSKKFSRMPAPICDVDFYHDGSMYAYAVGYDWSKGAEGAQNFGPDSNYIVLQHIDDGDMSVSSNSYHGHGGRGRGRGRRRNTRRGGG